METKLKTNFMDTPIILVGEVQDDSCRIVKEHSMRFTVKDFVDCVHTYSRELMYKLTGQDLHIKSATREYNAIDFYLSHYKDEHGNNLFPQFWIQINHKDEATANWLTEELIKQNNIKMGRYVQEV
jgi:hypothetical protein